MITFAGITIEVVCSYCILIPWGSTRRSTFWCQIEAHIFLIITQKYQLQIQCTLADIAENVHLSHIEILISCIFITASHQCHILFLQRRENKEQPWGKIVQNRS